MMIPFENARRSPAVGELAGDEPVARQERGEAREVREARVGGQDQDEHRHALDEVVERRRAEDQPGELRVHRLPSAGHDAEGVREGGDPEEEDDEDARPGPAARGAALRASGARKAGTPSETASIPVMRRAARTRRRAGRRKSRERPRSPRPARGGERPVARPAADCNPPAAEQDDVARRGTGRWAPRRAGPTPARRGGSPTAMSGHAEHARARRGRGSSGRTRRRHRRYTSRHTHSDRQHVVDQQRARRNKTGANAQVLSTRQCRSHRH